MTNNRTAPPIVMADLREDYAAILVGNLRTHIRRQMPDDDGKMLIYQKPTASRKLSMKEADRSAMGLQYKTVGERRFDLQKAIRNGEVLLECLIELVPRIFADHPRPIDMPVWLDYSLGVMVRNMVNFALFRYIRPEEISIDYLDLLQTENSASFLQKYLCPCGNTLLNFKLHYAYLRAKKSDTSADHLWLFEAYMTLEYAVKGRKMDTKESGATAGCGSIQSHKIDEYFEKGWTQLVLPEFKRDR